MYICMYVCMYVYMYVCMYVCTHTRYIWYIVIATAINRRHINRGYSPLYYKMCSLTQNVFSYTECVLLHRMCSLTQNVFIEGISTEAKEDGVKKRHA